MTNLSQSEINLSILNKLEALLKSQKMLNERINQYEKYLVELSDDYVILTNKVGELERFQNA